MSSLYNNRHVNYNSTVHTMNDAKSSPLGDTENGAVPSASPTPKIFWKDRFISPET